MFAVKKPFVINNWGRTQWALADRAAGAGRTGDTNTRTRTLDMMNMASFVDDRRLTAHMPMTH